MRGWPAGPRAAALLAALALPAAAFAHDTWLLPLRPVAPPGAELLLDLTSGMRFPANETAIKAERVAAARVRLGGATDTLGVLRPGPARALRLRAPLRRPGVAVLWLDLAPRELALDSAEVIGYLAEVGAPDSVRRAYLAPADGRPRRWRERYVKHAKAVVRASSPQRPAPAADSSWREPAGQALELVPEVDPTALRPGADLRLRLVGAGGAPVPYTAVGFVGAGAPRAGLLARTDAAGRVAFRLPAAGRWMARATVLRRAAGPDLDWESDFATLTGVVR